MQPCSTSKGEELRPGYQGQAQKYDLIYFRFLGHARLCGKDEVLVAKINTNYIN